MPLEHEIRDRLAGDLTLLEDGLELVDTEYKLPNAEGTRGFIDILARDRYGNFVVVELKRSNDAASRAIHELFKYAELLARERGLDEASVRCVLVSTAWEELRVPFSALVRTFPYDTIGIEIEVNDVGDVLTTRLIEPLEAARPHGVTGVHNIFLYGSPQERDEAWPEISRILSDVDAPDHVGLALDHELPFEGWPHAIYLAMGRVAPTERLLHWVDDVPDDSVEAPEGCAWEYRALCELCHQYGNARDIEIGYPDKLRDILARQGWRVSAVLREGRFAAQADLVGDEELVEATGGVSGASETALKVESTPARSGHWRVTRQKIAACLFGAPGWEGTITAFLDELESTQSDAELVLAAWNPCDLIGSIVNTITGGSSIPHLECHVTVGGEVSRVLVGTVAHRPRPDLVDAATAFERVYDDAMGWALARNLGATWHLDLDLCAQTGLDYVVTEFLPNDQGSFWLSAEGDVLVREAFDFASSEIRPLDEWITANAEALQSVVADMALHTHGIFPGLG